MRHYFPPRKQPAADWSLTKGQKLLSSKTQAPKIKIECPSPTKGVKQEKALKDRQPQQQPAWRQFTSLSGTATLDAQPIDMWQLLVERSRQEDKKVAGLWLQELAWERKRKDPNKKSPSTMSALVGYGRALADDYATKSKAQATWRAYSSWYGTFEAFCTAMQVSASDSWEDKVQVLRISVALMSQVYAMGTLSIGSFVFLENAGPEEPMGTCPVQSDFCGRHARAGEGSHEETWPQRGTFRGNFWGGGYLRWLDICSMAASQSSDVHGLGAVQ